MSACIAATAWGALAGAVIVVVVLLAYSLGVGWWLTRDHE